MSFATTTVKLQRSTRNVTQDSLVIDMSEDIAYLADNRATFAALAMRLSSKACHNPKFEWMEDRPLDWSDAVNGTTIVTATTTIPVDTPGIFRPGFLVQNRRTLETFLVTAVSGSNLTAQRGWGSTAASMNDDDVLDVTGDVNAEGADTPVAISTNETALYNYTQIFRTPFTVTNTERATTLYGPPEMVKQQAKNGREHMWRMNKAFLWGQRNEDTTDGSDEPKRSTRGIMNWISTNTTDASGTLTKSEFLEFVEDGMYYGSDTKYLLAGGIIVRAFAEWGIAELQLRPDDNQYGINITQWISPFGLVNIVYDKLLTQTASIATNQRWGGYGLLVDFANVNYRPLVANGLNRDTQLLTNRQGNGEDKRTDEYLTEGGLEVRLEETHSYLYNVSTIGT